GYFYAVAYIKRQPVGQAANNGECLMRTKTLDDPSSWRAWSGGPSFDTTFVDPYGPNADPTSHLCAYVSPGALGGLPAGQPHLRHFGEAVALRLRVGGRLLLLHLVRPDQLERQEALLCRTGPLDVQVRRPGAGALPITHRSEEHLARLRHRRSHGVS